MAAYDSCVGCHCAQVCSGFCLPPGCYPHLYPFATIFSVGTEMVLGACGWIVTF